MLRGHREICDCRFLRTRRVHVQVSLRTVTLSRDLVGYGRLMATKVTTPWGPSVVIEEVSIEQTAGEKAFASLVQLLEGTGGARFVRFAYTTGDAARRGPVTFRLEDVERLREALREKKGLARALGVRPR